MLSLLPVRKNKIQETTSQTFYILAFHSSHCSQDIAQVSLQLIGGLFISMRRHLARHGFKAKIFHFSLKN